MSTRFYNLPVDHGLSFDYGVTSVLAGPRPNTVILNLDSQPTLDIGDIIYFKKGQLEIPMFYIQAQVGPIGTNYNLVSYDNRIYSSPVGLTSALWSNYDFDSTINSVVPNYSIESEVVRAVYSVNMIEYNLKKRYSVNVRGLKSRYLADFQELATSGALFIGDDCAFNGDGVAYRVVLLQDAFDAFNNKFTKDLTFRLANV
jgi:hypothetical protein